MIEVTADAGLGRFLGGIKEEAVIRDDHGNILGRFTPEKKTEAELYAKARALFDPAETKRRKEAERGKGYTIEQVMERLKALEASECDTR